MNPSTKIRLFSYKLKHDTGFAPNPFHGACTLATCKPLIRKSKHPGDWIAGFTSKTLNSDEVGFERLIYLMQITEKMPLGDYYLDERFTAKIPTLHSGNCIQTVGDNIYRWLDDALVQIPNRSHTPEEAEKDIRGVYALISTCFYYFGSEPLFIPGNRRPSVPYGISSQGVRTHDQTRAQAFLNYVASNHTSGIHTRPTQWRSGDDSWMQL